MILPQNEIEEIESLVKEMEALLIKMEEATSKPIFNKKIKKDKSWIEPNE